jgi:hypothetical protein
MTIFQYHAASAIGWTDAARVPSWSNSLRDRPSGADLARHPSTGKKFVPESLILLGFRDLDFERSPLFVSFARGAVQPLRFGPCFRAIEAEISRPERRTAEIPAPPLCHPRGMTAR